MRNFLRPFRGIHKKNLAIYVAAQIQFSMDQPPIIYYGTEVGMSQPGPFSAFPMHGDLHARMPMEWEKPDTDLYEYYRKLIRDRAR